MCSSSLKQITFACRPAIEQFTQRVFCLPSKLFFSRHTKMLAALRHLLSPSTLQQHMQALEASMRAQLEHSWPDGGRVRSGPSLFHSALVCCSCD